MVTMEPLYSALSLTGQADLQPHHLAVQPLGIPPAGGQLEGP